MSAMLTSRRNFASATCFLAKFLKIIFILIINEIKTFFRSTSLNFEKRIRVKKIKL